MSKITLYGFETGCVFCDKAKETLNNRGVSFEFVDVSESDQFLEFFKTVHDTVPQIYVDGVAQEGGSEAAEVVGDTFVEDETSDWL